MKRSQSALLTLLAASFITACAHLTPVTPVTPVTPAPEAMREHDTRNAFVAAAETTFAAMPNVTTPTDRWAGVLGGAGYRIEVPSTNWNGKLAVYAHGYAGIGNTLTVQDPPIRRYLIDNGYHAFDWRAASDLRRRLRQRCAAKSGVGRIGAHW